MFSKVTKTVVTTALTLAMVIATAAVSPANANAAGLKLNKKSVKLTVGKQVTLKANKKAKFTTSNKKVATVSTKKAAKSVVVRGTGKGSATITAKAGSKKATCKVTVSAAAKGTVIYNLANEKGQDDDGKLWAAPFRASYDKVTKNSGAFKYSSFAIWLCRATFYDPANGGCDYRGKKIHIELSFKNSGKRDLPELGFCFNYTKGGSDGSYPFALHIKEKGFSDKEGKKVAKDDKHKHAKLVKSKIAKGKTYSYSFDFVIPSDAMNGDKDSKTGLNYPIMFFCANLKDSGIYKPGDEVTILKAKFTVAS